MNVQCCVCKKDMGQKPGCSTLPSHGYCQSCMLTAWLETYEREFEELGLSRDFQRMVEIMQAEGPEDSLLLSYRELADLMRAIGVRGADQQVKHRLEAIRWLMEYAYIWRDTGCEEPPHYADNARRLYNSVLQDVNYTPTHVSLAEAG